VPLARLIDAMSATPARILGLECGRLSPGAPADFALADLQKSWKVEDSILRSRSKNSPFEHRTLEGDVVETVVAGRSVFT
jgi:dihydroorotase